VVFAEFERSIIQERVQGRLGVSSILAVRLFFGTIILMKRQSLVPKKRRGPAPTGKGIQIQVRIQPNKLAQLDRWIANQNDRPSRPEAIRRIVERALAHSSRPKGIKKKAQKASDLASRAADRIIDKSIPSEEQRRRKRALIKGPKEFRDLRADLPESET
jgi:hypothetical protein